MARKPHRQHDGADEQNIPESDIVWGRAWDGPLLAVLGSTCVTETIKTSIFTRENQLGVPFNSSL